MRGGVGSSLVLLQSQGNAAGNFGLHHVGSEGVESFRRHRSCVLWWSPSFVCSSAVMTSVGTRPRTSRISGTVLLVIVQGPGATSSGPGRAMPGTMGMSRAPIVRGAGIGASSRSGTVGSSGTPLVRGTSIRASPFLISRPLSV